MSDCGGKVFRVTHKESKNMGSNPAEHPAGVMAAGAGTKAVLCPVPCTTAGRNTVLWGKDIGRGIGGQMEEINLGLRFQGKNEIYQETRSVSFPPSTPRLPPLAASTHGREKPSLQTPCKTWDSCSEIMTSLVNDVL